MTAKFTPHSKVVALAYLAEAPGVPPSVAKRAMAQVVKVSGLALTEQERIEFDYLFDFEYDLKDDWKDYKMKIEEYKIKRKGKISK
jgi:hypothetical protein